MVSDSPTAMLTVAGSGLTCLPVTVMSIRRTTDVGGGGLVGDAVAASVAAPVVAAGSVVGATTGVSVCEQDVRTTAAVKERATVSGLRSLAIVVTVRSLGSVLTR